MLHVVALLGCAAAIYLSCEWFVNAVEWLGQRLDVGPLAVGSVLAAVGTALPESVVTFVAVVFGGSSAQHDIGVGAAMGGPLVLATIAYGVTGVMLQARRRASAPAADSGTPLPDTGGLARDQTWFLTIAAAKVALGLVAFAGKRWLGLLFFSAYAAYFVRQLGGGGRVAGPAPAPLLLQRTRPAPATWAIATQTAATLGIIFVASQLFVSQLDAVGPMLGLSPSVTALLLSPIATELPETMNAIIWVRQGKLNLALANISGAMMIQTTVPTGLGLLFTPWRFDAAVLSAGLVTATAVGYLLVMHWRGRLRPATLTAAAGFYLVFAGTLVPILR